MPSMWALLAVAAVVLPGATASAVSPVEKVLQMMEDLKAKSLKEKNEDMVTFKTFTQFCMDTNSAKTKAISDGVDQIEKLTADMGKANADAKKLGREIDKLDAAIAKSKSKKDKNTKDFEMEEGDYQKMHAEYDLNIADTEKAIRQIQTMMAAENMMGKGQKKEGAASLLQLLVSKPSYPLHAKRVLMSFLSTSTSLESELGEPEGNTYESQSGGVIELMQELAQKFADQKAKLEREFVKTQGSHQVLQQQFVDQLDQHNMMRDVKAGTKKDKEGDAANAEGDIASTQNMKAEDEAYLKDVNAECAAKASDYEARQKLAAGEVKALNKAIELISGDAVSGAADKHLPSLAQEGVSLSQLRNSVSTEKRPSQSVAASFLQAQGRTINSRLLATLALHVKNDPFGKVKKMIEDMVMRLMEEANEEAEHKGFCDTELGQNKMTRDQKTTEVEELTANIDELTSHMGQLGVEIGDLSERIAETDAAVQKATSIREDEKAKNAATIAEASGAKDAVGKALGVLRDYYESAAGAAFLQVHSSTGILGMLEVILSDFERLEADTKASEKTNQQEFQKFLNDSSQEKAIAEQQVKNKAESRTEADVSLGAAKRDLASAQEELGAAEAYFEKLKPSCVQEAVSYDDRVERRQDELESLKEALKILDEQPIA